MSDPSLAGSTVVTATVLDGKKEAPLLLLTAPEKLNTLGPFPDAPLVITFC